MSEGVANTGSMGVRQLEAFGRTRLSRHFFMRDFLYSDIAAVHGFSNIPDDPDLAIIAGKRLCEELLEPLQATFGRIAIRSAYRSCEVNAFCNAHGLGCARNEVNYAAHIWDRRDADGFMGATACIVIPRFADRYASGTDWRAMAWWIHDHLPYSDMAFFPKLAALNLRWHERPNRRIKSNVEPKGTLTEPGRSDHNGSHAAWYEGFPALVKPD